MSAEGSRGEVKGQDQGQESRQPLSALRAPGSADFRKSHWMPLSLLSPESCYIYSDECYQQQGSGNKVSGSVADQSTTGENDVILLPVILDEWESNVRYVVYVCVLSQKSCSRITWSRAEGKMSHRIILEKGIIP